jgi:hypothetical protein
MELMTRLFQGNHVRSDEMKYDEKKCWICLDTDNEQDFISPCLCRGSIKFVHRACLDNWRATKPDAFDRCNQCHFKYVYVPYDDNPNKELDRLLAYYWGMFKYIMLFLIINEAIAVLFTFIAFGADPHKEIIKLFTDNVETTHWFAIYHFTGWVLYFAFIGLMGLCIAACSGSSSSSGGGGTYCFYCGDCHGSSSNSDNKACGIILLIIIIILAIFGLFIGIWFACEYFGEKSKAISDRVWKLQETTRFIVKDFFGRENELNA